MNGHRVSEPCPAPIPNSYSDQDDLRPAIPQIDLPAPVCSIFRLTFSSVLLGAVTACAMALAVATDRWLFTQEPYQFSQEELKQFNMTDRSLIPKIQVKVRSGLWRVCTTDIQASSGAIRYSSPAFVTALVFVALATIMLFIGSVQRSSKTLFASVLYVSTGLSLAIGIIVYISAVNDEVGYSTNKSTYKDFRYHYGLSFYCACFTFLTAEGSAVLSALQFLRIKTQTQSLADVVPGLEEHLISQGLGKESSPSIRDHDNLTYCIDTMS